MSHRQLSIPPACPHCRYDLRTHTTCVCPECGGSVRSLVRVRRRRVVWLAVVFGCIGLPVVMMVVWFAASMVVKVTVGEPWGSGRGHWAYVLVEWLRRGIFLGVFLWFLAPVVWLIGDMLQANGTNERGRRLLGRMRFVDSAVVAGVWIAVLGLIAFLLAVR